MESFARELRLHCARKGSIAQLCKATGINRQQFNKYLAGQMLPGARTMRKICTYLGVSEEVLMSGRPAATGGQATATPAIDFGAFFSRFSGSEGSAALPKAVLPNGFYRAYFPVPGRPGLAARWLVQIATRPDGTPVHSARNRFHDGAALGFAGNRITYRGPVVYGGEEAGLLGTARAPLPLNGIIFVTLRPVVGEDYFSAMVLTRRADGPLALSGAMQFLGESCTARHALSGMGVIALDDPSADPVIVQLMRSAPAAATNWMRAVTERNLQAEPGGSGLPEALAVRRLSV